MHNVIDLHLPDGPYPIPDSINSGVGGRGSFTIISTCLSSESSCINLQGVFDSKSIGLLSCPPSSSCKLHSDTGEEITLYSSTSTS